MRYTYVAYDYTIALQAHICCPFLMPIKLIEYVKVYAFERRFVPLLYP